MRYLTTLLYLLAALHSLAAPKSGSANTTNEHVIKIDESHRMNNRPKGVQGEPYQVPASSNLVVEATGYKFDVLVGMEGKSINSIQLIQDKTHQFALAWEAGKTRYELSKNSLKPVTGSKTFEGFNAGDRIVLGIGILYETNQFAPVWVGMIEVR